METFKPSCMENFSLLFKVGCFSGEGSGYSSVPQSVAGEPSGCSSVPHSSAVGEASGCSSVPASLAEASGYSSVPACMAGEATASGQSSVQQSISIPGTGGFNKVYFFIKGSYFRPDESS